MKFTISYDKDLTEILPITSVLITEYSIVAVEAAFNEIPVIVANFFRGKDDEYSIAYKNEGIAIHVSNITELCNCMEKILNDKDTKSKLENAINKFNHDYNYLHDGNSAKRICKILTEIKSDKISIRNSHKITS